VPVPPDLEAELERESDDCSDDAPYVLRRELMTDGSLTKAALIKEGAAVAGFTKRRAEIVVDTVFGSIVETLRRGEKVELRGFGSFRLRRREPHRGRNPRTGDRVEVPSKHVAYFAPGRELKALINRDPTQPDLPPMSE